MGSAVERQMQATVAWPSLLGVISTLSTPSTRPTSSALKKNGLGRGQRCLKASFSGKHQKISSNSTIVPSFPSTSRSITLARVGRWWRTPPSKKAPQHNKFIRTSTQNQPNSSLSPSTLAVTSITFSSSSCDLSNRQATSLQRKYSKVVQQKKA